MCAAVLTPGEGASEDAVRDAGDADSCLVCSHGGSTACEVRGLVVSNEGFGC